MLAFREAAGVEFHIVDAGHAPQKTTEPLGKRLDVIGTQAGDLVRDYLDTKNSPAPWHPWPTSVWPAAPRSTR